jgi:hypothetical protein
MLLKDSHARDIEYLSNNMMTSTSIDQSLVMIAPKWSEEELFRLSNWLLSLGFKESFFNSSTPQVIFTLSVTEV